MGTVLYTHALAAKKRSLTVYPTTSAGGRVSILTFSMLKRFKFMPRTLSRLTGESRRRVAVVATMALLHSVVPTLVESLAIKQITFAGAWAQSATAPAQEATAGEEKKITPTGEQEKVPAEVPEGVPEVDQGTARPEQEADRKEIGEQDQEEEEEGYVDRVHRWLSGGVGESAEDVDRFFGDENYESEATNTRLRLRFDTFFEEHEDVDFRVRVNLRLVLPKTNKRLKLTFSGSEDTDENDDLGSVTGSDDDTDANASLALTVVDTTKQNVSLRTGIKSGPAWWIGPRYRFYTKLGPIWGFRFTQLLRWLTDDGWEFRTTFDFERKIGEKFFFRTRARGTYNQDDWDDDGYKYRLEAKLFQFVTPNIGLRYEWINKFITKPDNHLDEIILKFGYRQRIWRKWLFFEIVPQASFPDDRDFEFVPGILFRVETNFGKQYIGKIK